jgi:hypothetical protein
VNEVAGLRRRIRSRRESMTSRLRDGILAARQNKNLHMGPHAVVKTMRKGINNLHALMGSVHELNA